MSKTKWTPERVAEVLKWRAENGETVHATAAHFGLTPSALRQGLQKFKKKGGVVPKKQKKAKPQAKTLTLEIPDTPPPPLVSEQNHVAIMSLKTFNEFIKGAQW